MPGLGGGFDAKPRHCQDFKDSDQILLPVISSPSDLPDKKRAYCLPGVALRL
jgi:hypothetical protein